MARYRAARLSQPLFRLSSVGRQTPKPRTALVWTLCKSASVWGTLLRLCALLSHSHDTTEMLTALKGLTGDCAVAWPQFTEPPCCARLSSACWPLEWLSLAATLPAVSETAASMLHCRCSGSSTRKRASCRDKHKVLVPQTTQWGLGLASSPRELCLLPG